MRKLKKKPSRTQIDRLGIEMSMFARTSEFGLTNAEIVDKVSAYMLQKETTAWKAAYEEFSFSDELKEGTPAFDPLTATLNEHVDQRKVLSRVLTLVETKEKELLLRAAGDASAYNVLLFGAALKLRGGSTLSEELASFVADHLTSPSDFSKSAKGRPKRDPLLAERKLFAILYAMSHGLPATRRESNDPNSACDIVSEAALKLAKQGRRDFSHGYGYETLRKIYAKYPEL